jgi:hypothetical protein
VKDKWDRIEKKLIPLRKQYADKAMKIAIAILGKKSLEQRGTRLALFQIISPDYAIAVAMLHARTTGGGAP